MSKIIELQKLKKSYNGRNFVLNGVDLVINSGEIAVITGQSGSGKSTLLNVLGLLDSYDEGSYYLDSNLVKLKENREFALLRNRKFGFVFQSYHLISNLTVKENLMIPLLYRQGRTVNLKKFDDDVRELLQRFDLIDMLDQKVSGMSGGEKQRISLCRALIADPEIILADEPTGNLDEGNKEKIMETFQNIGKQFKKTVLIVTHDNQFKEIADRSFHISGGYLIEEVR